MAIQAMTHLAIRVRDLERSLCFYRDLLGFTRTHGRPGGRSFRPADRQPGGQAVRGLPRRDGVVVELQQLEGVDGPVRRVNLGFSHIGFRVTDLAVLVETLRAAGAEVLEGLALSGRDLRIGGHLRH